MFQMQFELHTKKKIAILISKHNLQQGIQHQQISNKSPDNFSTLHKEIHEFRSLARVSKSTCLNPVKIITLGLEPSLSVELPNRRNLFKYIFTIMF